MRTIIKNASTFTPKTNEYQELETMCKNLSETKINKKKLLIPFPT